MFPRYTTHLWGRNNYPDHVYYTNLKVVTSAIRSGQKDIMASRRTGDKNLHSHPEVPTALRFPHAHILTQYF